MISCKTAIFKKKQTKIKLPKHALLNVSFYSPVKVAKFH